MKTTEVIKTNNYAVHFEIYEGVVRFICYPISVGTKLSGEEVLMYFEKEDEQTPLYDFDKEQAFSRLQGTYLWRGMWEGRLCFTDEEYWSSDLQELNDLFNDYIEPFCKEKINNHYEEDLNKYN